MKISKEFVLREIAGNYIVVPIGENAVSFKAMITLNKTGAFLWKQLEAERTEEELLVAILEEYDIDSETAKTDIAKFIEKIQTAGILTTIRKVNTPSSISGGNYLNKQTTVEVKSPSEVVNNSIEDDALKI